MSYRDKPITRWMRDYEITANLWRIISLKMEINQLERELREIDDLLKRPDLTEVSRQNLEAQRQIYRGLLEDKIAELNKYLRK